jgi:hypothetical protein
VIELLLEAEGALSLGLLDRAELLYRQVAGSDPRNSIAVVGLARVTLERGDEAGALKLARRALAIDPENVAAQRLTQRLEEVLRFRGVDVPTEPGRTPAGPSGAAPPMPDTLALPAAPRATVPEEPRAPMPEAPRATAPTATPGAQSLAEGLEASASAEPRAGAPPIVPAEPLARMPDSQPGGLPKESIAEAPGTAQPGALRSVIHRLLRQRR